MNQILKQRKATIAQALRWYDELAPVDLEFMKGRWRGFEIATGHPMDGLLDLTGWYGKVFIGPEDVHPLVFFSGNKKALYVVNPRWIPLNINFPKTRFLSVLMGILTPILKTEKPKARMRMVEYRGKITGAMVYDHKAIIDLFAKIDDNTMLGIMDLKGDQQPYAFVLERDSAAYQMKF